MKIATILLAGLFANIAHAGSNHTLEILSGHHVVSYSGDLSAIDQVGAAGMIVFVSDGPAIEYRPDPPYQAPPTRTVGVWSADVLSPQGWMTRDGCRIASITILADHSHIHLVCPVR
jgi:hypothetical protein